MAQKHSGFEVGDRVYWVPGQGFTGSVTEISTITGRVRVNWDGINYDEPPHCYRFDWFDAAELDYWTRPEAAGVEVR